MLETVLLTLCDGNTQTRFGPCTGTRSSNGDNGIGDPQPQTDNPTPPDKP